MKRNISIILCALIFTLGCASTYEMTKPRQPNYISGKDINGIQLQYKYHNTLGKNYEKKARKKSLKLVSIKIYNGSDRDLVFNKDIVLTYNNGSGIFLIENMKTYHMLRQNVVSYLLYLLLTPLTLYTGQGSTNFTATPIGLVLGPGLTALNMIKAITANKQLKNELLEYNVIGYTIKRGETKYGLVGFQATTFDEISFRVK